jgi:hypothetical protein
MQTKPNLQALEQFAKTNAPSRCQVCVFSERAWIEEAKRKGYGAALIAKYLVETCGHPVDLITDERITHHFRRNHHLRKIN